MFINVFLRILALIHKDWLDIHRFAFRSEKRFFSPVQSPGLTSAFSRELTARTGQIKALDQLNHILRDLYMTVFRTDSLRIDGIFQSKNY